MYKQRYFLIFVVLLSVFSLSTCEFDGSGSTGSSQYFEWDLREVWVSQIGSIYQGEIEITYNTIRITGYPETQAQFPNNINQLPFRNIPKGVIHKGYSENGRIYIENYASDGISYKLDEVGAYYPYTRILSFEFGGRTEILQIQ